MNKLYSSTGLVGALGDLHGNTPWTRVTLNTFDKANIRIILQLGDFGINSGEQGYNHLRITNRVLEENKQTLLVTLGNHENYDEIKSFLPHPEMEGFIYKKEFPNIIIANRGARFTINETSFVSLGGANSIDRIGRIQGVDWWTEEQITEKDILSTVKGGYADIMLTHDCPEGINLWNNNSPDEIWTPEEVVYSELSRKILKRGADGVKSKLLLHGHYHFFNDITEKLNSDKGDYTTRSIGLGMDGSNFNLGVIKLNSLDYTVLPISWDARNYTKL